MRAPADQLTQTQLGEFRLTQCLGHGGMAVVYRGEHAFDASILRAIKVIREELSTRADFVQRVAEEARVLDRLDHPNIVRFYGLRLIDGRLVIELELLEGWSLARYVGRPDQRLPPHACVSFMQQAAEGVGYAHGLKYIHRDVKPDNIFVTRLGRVKVLDFGLARALDEADRAAKVTTLGGGAPGSPGYMAPEIWAGAMPSAASDVYALGVSLFELLLGHHPFEPLGKPRLTQLQLMARHVDATWPRLRDVRSDVPGLVAEVVERAIAKEPSRRYPSAREFAAALRGAAASMPQFQVASMGAQTQFDLPTFEPGTPVGPPTAPSHAGEFSPARRSAMPFVFVVCGGLAVAAGGIIARVVSKPDQAAEAASRGCGPTGCAAGSECRDNACVAVGTAAAPCREAAPKCDDGLMCDASSASCIPTAGHEGKACRPDGTCVDALVCLADTCTDLSRAGLVRIPGGSAGPNTVAQAWLGAHEVTVDEYAACVEAGKCHARADEVNNSEVTGDPHKVCNWGRSARGKHPMNCVSWYDALSYCEWRGLVLPPEANWAWAARGREFGTAYPWGDEHPGAAQVNACGPECAEWLALEEKTDVSAMYSQEDGWPTTAPVGSKPAGATRDGVHDLAGNVWEWTGTVVGTARVIRGGGWRNEKRERMSLVGGRGEVPPAQRSGFIGFRCVLLRDGASIGTIPPSGTATAVLDSVDAESRNTTTPAKRTTPSKPTMRNESLDVDCILDPKLPKCNGAFSQSSSKRTPSSVDPSLPETLDPTEIKAGVSPVKGDAKSCASKHGAQPGESVKVRLSIAGSTGLVTSASAEAPHRDTPLGNCVAIALKAATFPRFRKATLGAVYPVKM